jgi:alpha-tubulin suppressor-like RCC1 family protein
LLIAFGRLLKPELALGQATTASALSFDGTDDVVTVANNPLLELTTGTLELWFKPNWTPGTLTYDPVLIGNQLGPALTRYSVHVDRNLGGIALANGTTTSSVPCSFTSGQWAHLALASSGPGTQVFVNGQPIGATSNTFGTLIGLPLNLGSDGGGEFFPGELEEVRVWNAPRSATDIRYNMSRAMAGSEPGLVAYWRLHEGVGAVAIDATANRLDGTLIGPTWTNSTVALVNTSGSLGIALDLTASRATYVQVAASASLALSNQFTFEAWVNARAAQCNTILSRGDGANLANTDFVLQVGSDGTNCGVMKVALMIGGTWTTSASAVPLNAWTHVAVTWDGLTNRFYLNGVLDEAVAAPGPLYQSGSPLFIGRQGTVGTNYFEGTIDEVRVWNVVRSPSQIQGNLTGTLPSNSLGLVANWNFNEQAGIQAFDRSGNGNHGKLIGRPVRVISYWAPVLTLNGSNPIRQECHTPFTDPGIVAAAVPTVLAGGGAHALLLRPDATAFSWGYDAFGQTDAPPRATNLIAVAGGGNHTLALQADGSALGWGYNFYGQSSIPPSATNVIAVQAGANHSLALRSDGTVLAWGAYLYGETNVPPDATNLVIIATGPGADHSLAIKADGTVVIWGSQTGAPSNANGAIALAAGYDFSLALKADGTVVAWGANDSGQITVPSRAVNIVAVAAGAAHSLALKADGTVVGWGYNNVGQSTIPPSATNVVAIAAGKYFSLALRADGAILGWGDATYGVTTTPANATTLNPNVTVRGSVDATLPGSYALGYSVSNGQGAVSTTPRAVVVTDTAPPTLTILGPNPLTLVLGTPFVDPGATASDACAGDLTAGIVRTGAVNTTVPGPYAVTYTATDASGNSATNARTVLVTAAPSVLGFSAIFSGTNLVTGSPVVQFVADIAPNGLSTVASASYGLTTAYPGATASVNFPASFNESSFYATLDGLIPGATYHFRITASNSLGITYGPDETFTVPQVFRTGDINGDGRVDALELSTVVSNYLATNPGLVMTNPAALGAGRFQFAITNETGWDFNVLASTNLLDWAQLPGAANPVWQFLDPSATNSAPRFYRIRSP